MKVICLFFPEGCRRLQALAEACLQLSPQVALGHLWLFVEIQSCQNIMDADEFLVELKKVCALYGEEPIFTLGEDIPSSLCRARFHVDRKEDFPLEALIDYFDPFQVNGHEKLFAKEMELLKSLGLHKMKDLKKLAHQEVTSRFNKKLRQALDCWLYGSQKPWPFFKVSESLSELTVLHYRQQVTSLEPLLFVLRPLVERLCARLVGRGLKANALELLLTQESYSHVEDNPRRLEVRLSFAHNDSETLFKILQERLQQELQRNSLQAPVVEVEALITESVLARSLQKDFFSHSQEKKEAQEALMLRMEEKLGANRVFYAQLTENYLPEQNWQKQSSPPMSVELNLPRRPLRLFHPPQKVTCAVGYVVNEKKRWRLQGLYGPERLQGQWWGHSHYRDYFIAHCFDGPCLWLFRQDKQFYLHGIFD